MNNQTPSKLEYAVKVLNNILHKKKLIIFLGSDSVKLYALKSQTILEKKHINFSDESYEQQYRRFLKKYRNFYITFLLDNQDCALKHEIMPILSSIIKANPVEKFISENYHQDDVVAYNVYEVQHQPGEVWHTNIASTPMAKYLRELIYYVINNSFKYSGMYFLSLEFKTIIEKILHITGNTNCLNHLQIFVTITEINNIRIVVKYKKNVMDEQVIEYPHDKSDMYVQGTIEQAISDKLLFYKEYIAKLGLKTCIIFLVDEPLKELLGKLEIKNSILIPVSGKEIAHSPEYQDQRFLDDVIVENFDSLGSHLALSKALRSITQLSLVNNIIFKPFIIGITALAASLAYTKYQTILVQNDTRELNKKYYALSEDYREVQKRHPKLENISDLVDLYNLQNLINTNAVTPFSHIKHIIPDKNSDISIKNLQWIITNPESFDPLQRNLKIQIDLEYKADESTAVEGIEKLNSYTNHLRSFFYNYKLTYQRDNNNISNVAKKVIIPAKITITGKIGGDKNAR